MSPDARQRILDAAASLLAESGSEALSTRAVAAAANIQAPTLYRIFGDKQGLIEAVTAYGFERYLADKQAQAPTGDPVEDLRRGWDLHVEFALTHPDFYALMYGSVRPGHQPAVPREATGLLVAMLERVAHAGRLRVPVATAAQMTGAASVGVALALIARPEQERDPALSARVREAMLDAILTDPHPARDGAGPARDGADTPLAARALALDAALAGAPPADDAPPAGTPVDTSPDTSSGGAAAAGAAPAAGALTAAETALLRQWLRRLAEGPHDSTGNSRAVR
ncbi:TetR/AcrR family transcriptional regulator [Rugosimonospora acidiphila]|uniref:TetR/AcrR family transcriptional regulator n=1 Tax=Rugosimonospora acidiphila TaxID=556531 RepID=A0ABP9RHJ1_9ACTN